MIIGWGCCLLIVIGAFGPWIKTAFGQSASGLDNSNDGWIMLIGALFAAFLIARFLHDPDRRSRVLRATVLTLLGAARAGVGIYDWHHADDVLSRRHGLASVGWGLQLATLAAAALAVNSFFMIAARPRAVGFKTSDYEELLRKG
jgi:hypothetical protein